MARPPVSARLHQLAAQEGRTLSECGRAALLARAKRPVARRRREPLRDAVDLRRALAPVGNNVNQAVVAMHRAARDPAARAAKIAAIYDEAREDLRILNDLLVQVLGILTARPSADDEEEAE